MGVLYLTRIPCERMRPLLYTAETHDFGCDTCTIFLVVFSNRFIFNTLQDLNTCTLVNDLSFLAVYDGTHAPDNIFKVSNILTFA